MQQLTIKATEFIFTKMLQRVGQPARTSHSVKSNQDNRALNSRFRGRMTTQEIQKAIDLAG